MKATPILCWTLLALLAAGTASAARTLGDQRRARPARGEIIDEAQTIDVNNIRMFVTNTGSFAWDKIHNFAPGFEYPQGTGKTAVYAAGLWLGAKVNGEIRLAISEYSDEYAPGSALGGVADDPSRPEYKVYKLNRVYNDPGVRDAALLDYTNGAVPHGAPPIAVQPDGSLNILGDQMMWAVYNDLDPTLHNNRADGLLKALGVEVQQTTFAFSAQGALGNTIFIKYKFINRGSNQLDEMYVSQWSDPDLGGATDDLVGCDIGLSVGFVYNATNSDGLYGANVPSVGFDFFQGPKVGGSPLPQTSFNKYINGTDPNTAAKSYHYMQGLDADSNTVINPITGAPTTFVVSGDPVAGTGWLDTAPADRRLMLSSGPFSMAPGDSQEVVVGMVVGQSVNRLASIALMKFFDQSAQSAFDLNFNVPPPPDPPAVTVTPEDGAVLLTWDSHAESYNVPQYRFEGYAVYQDASASKNGPFTPIATFDFNDGITTVLDDLFDEQSYIALPKVSARGNDGGIKYQLRVISDAVRGGPLYNGTPYYFTVRSYSVSPNVTPHVKESADTIRTVVPQTPPGDVDLASTAITAGPTYGQYNTALPPTKDSVQVVVVDPNQVLTASYRVGYKPDASGTPTWYLTRTVGAATDTVVNNWTNFADDAQHPIVDGLLVRDLGTISRALNSVDYVDVGPNPPGLVPDAGIGAPFWDPLGTGGGSDYAANNFGSALDPADGSKFNNVEIRFTGGPAGQKAYRYLRCNCSPRTYLFQDYVDVPFTVWDVDNNRQLNVGFLENFPNANGVWDPDTLDDFGGPPNDDRQFIQVYASTYSATAQTIYTTTYPDWLNDVGNIDLQYYVWPRATTTPLTIDNGDKFVFTMVISVFGQPSTETANDYVTFSTQGANRSSTALAKGELDRCKAVPNPYFAHSAYEKDQFNRVVKFTHLPQRCTLRLFNLAGDLVRTIVKDDGTSQVSWNLETNSGLPVGSGIYVFHVDAPGIGTKVGKVAIFVEKERLNNY